MRWITIVLICILVCRMNSTSGRPTEEIDQENPAENPPTSESEQAAETDEEESSADDDRYEQIRPNDLAAREAESSEENNNMLEESVQEKVDEQPDSQDDSQANESEANTGDTQESDTGEQQVPENGTEDRQIDSKQDDESPTSEPSSTKLEEKDEDSEPGEIKSTQATEQPEATETRAFENTEEPNAIESVTASDKPADEDESNTEASLKREDIRSEKPGDSNEELMEPDDIKSTEATEQTDATEDSAVENTEEPNPVESVTASDTPDNDDDNNTEALINEEDKRSEKSEDSNEDLMELKRSDETTVAPASLTSTAEAETSIPFKSTSHSLKSDEEEESRTVTPTPETESQTVSTESSVIASASDTKLLRENQTDSVTTTEGMQEPSNQLTPSHESLTSDDSSHTTSSLPSHDEESKVTSEETRVRELDDVDSIDQTSAFKSFEFDMPVFNDSIYQDLMMNESEWMKEMSLLGSLDDDYVVHDACNFISENIQKLFGINVTKEQVHDSLPTFRFLFEADTEALTTIKDMLLSCVEATSQNSTTNPGCIQIKSLIAKTCEATKQCRGGEHNLLLQTMERIREVINTNHLNDALLMLRACATQSYD